MLDFFFLCKDLLNNKSFLAQLTIAVFDLEENIWGGGTHRKCWLPAFAPVPRMFQRPKFQGSLKLRVCGKVLKKKLYPLLYEFLPVTYKSFHLISNIKRLTTLNFVLRICMQEYKGNNNRTTFISNTVELEQNSPYWYIRLYPYSKLCDIYVTFHNTEMPLTLSQT